MEYTDDIEATRFLLRKVSSYSRLILKLLMGVICAEILSLMKLTLCVDFCFGKSVTGSVKFIPKSSVVTVFVLSGDKS